MRFSVATNFDNALLDRISSYEVEDVYGKLSSDPVGGGRASYSAQGAGKARLAMHVKHAHSKGIKFNYLLNSACMGNREWTASGIRGIRRLLDWLTGIKVDSLTISTPYIAEFVKKNYPHFFLKIGIFANIDSSERARFWEDLGAGMLTLESFSINRNFVALEAIRKAVSCRLQLIANFTCLPRCPMQPYHMAGLSHASARPDKAPFVDYCVLKCSYHTLRDPRLLLRSQWIRPEDVARYEGMGYTDLKLLERGAPTDVMVNRLEAYSKRASPANLLELIQPFGFKKDNRMAPWQRLKNILPFISDYRGMGDIMSLLKKRGMLYPLESDPVFLEARNIPGDFLEAVSSRACISSEGCDSCGYCDKIAGAAYRVDELYYKECMRLYEKIWGNLCSR